MSISEHRLHWALALDSAATDLSKTALKTPAGSPLKITSTLQTCLSLVSLTHTHSNIAGRAVVLWGEQKGWRGRRKGVGFPLPWQQLQTHTIHSSYERLCTAVVITLTRQQQRAFPHFTSKHCLFHSAEKCEAALKRFQVCALSTHWTLHNNKSHA